MSRVIHADNHHSNSHQNSQFRLPPEIEDDLLLGVREEVVSSDETVIVESCTQEPSVPTVPTPAHASTSNSGTSQQAGSSSQPDKTPAEKLVVDIEISAPAKTVFKVHRCEVCGARYTHPDNFRKHKLIHTARDMADKDNDDDDVDVANSTIKEVKFNSRFAAAQQQAQQQQQMNSQQQQDQQNQQPSVFQRYTALQMDEKPFKCDFCDAMFSQSYILKQHELFIHTSNKQHKCHVCKRRFTNLGNLQKHEKLHTGQKPFKCGVCDAMFFQSNGLKRHSLIHTYDHQFKCTMCKASFHRKSALTNHSKVHKIQDFQDIKPTSSLVVNETEAK